MNPLLFDKTEVLYAVVVVAIALSVPLIAGVYLDTRQDSWPAWTVVGVIVGCTISVCLVCLRVSKRLDAWARHSDTDVEGVHETTTYPDEEEPAQCQNC